MKNLKRILCLLLCAIMLLGVLAGCKKDEGADGDGENVTTVSTDSGDENLDENGYEKDDITEDMTYGGALMRIVSWAGNERYTLPEDGGTTQLDAEIYYSRLSVEERLDVTTEVTYLEGKGNDPGYSIMTAFINNVTAGVVKYDLIQGFCLYPTALARDGFLHNLNNLEFPHLDDPWYPEEIKEWEQHGGLYFVANNSSACAIRSMILMYANTEMITNVDGLTDPVDLVLSGDWTIDKMMEYSQAFESTAEVGDGYGLVVDDFSRVDAFYYGAGFRSTVNDSNGVAKMALDDASYLGRVDDYLDKLVTFFNRADVYVAPDEITLMQDKKTAFMIARMGKLLGLSDNSYAPLPMPKLDKDSSYSTMLDMGVDVWCIPKTTEDAERSGVFIEAISSSEYRSVAPYLFETQLKARYAQGTKGEQVFDIIHNSVVYDFGRMAQSTFKTKTVEGIWRECLTKWDSSINHGVKDPKNVITDKWATFGGDMKTELLTLTNDIRNNNR